MAPEAKRPIKVFLCHASGDKLPVRDLYKRLTNEGVDAWLDKEKLLPGQDWQAEIPRAVREADVVVVCLSNKSITKEGYVQKEIKFALDIAEEKPEGTIFLIPARLEDCPVPERLSRWQWVDLYEENGFLQLLRSLKLRAGAVGAVIEAVSYEDTDKELERRFSQLYTEGLEAFYTEDWDKACRRFQAILSERPNHKNARTKLEEAESQRLYANLYTEATEAYRSENWAGAISALEELSKKAPSYKDAAQLLRDAQKRKQLAELYAEAKALHAAQKWQAVIKVFDQITIIEPNYPDVDGLMSSAQKELTEAKRLSDLNEQYSHALHEMEVGNWYEARRLLEIVHKSQVGFLETEKLLKKVENEILKEEERHRQNEQIDVLYEQAHGLLRSRKWRNVLDKLEEIRKLDEHFPDPNGIAEKAQKEIDREEREAERQNKLAALYAESVRLLKEGKYQEALGKWQEVREVDPQYPDRQGVQRIARNRLSEAGKIVNKKRTRSFVFQKRYIPILILLSVILVSTLGVLILKAQPSIFPPCTTVLSLSDPLFIESSFNSTLKRVDGKITYPSEWAGSKCYKLRLAAQPPGQGCGTGNKSVPFEWYLMNDEQRLYMLIRFSKHDFTPTGIHFSYFYPYPLSGEWQFSDSMAYFGSRDFDQYGWNASKGKWSDDVSDGGTMDTRVKSSQDGQSYWFELSKPLDSGDSHDWLWRPGDKVGTGLTGDLMIGSFGTSSSAGEAYGCRMIQLQLGKNNK
jgi:outer membrane protein assembly factor BamD (BamD/ComL family)